MEYRGTTKYFWYALKRHFCFLIISAGHKLVAEKNYVNVFPNEPQAQVIKFPEILLLLNKSLDQEIGGKRIIGIVNSSLEHKRNL
ncbi:hypothetical protein A9Q90_06895 [Gammaproteobacteria bacterium 54_18_T64]|nr:hypothetical protein A9Q90_06895 [Gammaproteobacteria bacterium 54_18_T64]